MALFPAFGSALGGLGSVTRLEILAGKALLSWRVMSGGTIPFDHCLSARQRHMAKDEVRAEHGPRQRLRLAGKPGEPGP